VRNARGAKPFIPSRVKRIPGSKHLKRANDLLELLVKDDGYTHLDRDQTHNLLCLVQFCISKAERKIDQSLAEPHVPDDGKVTTPTD
jgi:hypothetical protein